MKIIHKLRFLKLNEYLDRKKKKKMQKGNFTWWPPDVCHAAVFQCWAVSSWGASDLWRG